MTDKKLFYRIAGHNGGVVFAPPDEAIRVSQIHKAIGESKTWGQFREAMPENDYFELVDRIVENRREAYEHDETEIHDDMFIPNDEDLFNGEQVPGLVEGDYPDWLQQDMDLYLPRDILDKYAEREESVHNGSYWMIPKENLEAVCEELKFSGWELESAQDLEFY